MLLLVLALGTAAEAQVQAISGQAVSQTGQPVPFAKVRVCSITSTGATCTPTSPIFFDYTLSMQSPNPFTADQYGNYTFYVPPIASPNLYVVQFSPNSGLTWSYVQNGPVTGGGGGSGCVPSGTAFQMLLQGSSGGCVGGIQYGGTNNLDATNAGAIQAVRTNYTVPGTELTGFPLNNPWSFTQYQNIRNSYDDQVYPIGYSLFLNSGGSDSAFNPSTNYIGLDGLFQIHTPYQGGGFDALQGDAFSTNDTVLVQKEISSAGITRGDNEGFEPHRERYTFTQPVFGGLVTNLGADPVGNLKFNADPTTTPAYCGWNNGGPRQNQFCLGEQRPLVDKTKKWTSPGNIASMVSPATTTGPDNRFFELNGDGGSGIDVKFGVSTFAYTISAADFQQYNTSCPSTVVGPNYQTDPYTSDGNGIPAGVDGSGTATQHFCLNFDTTGFSVGDVVIIADGGSNWEYTTIQSIPSLIVDPTHTHAVVNLKRPHSASSIVSTGGAVGWALQGGYDTTAGSNVYYPAVASIAGNHIVFYANSEATIFNAEWKSLIFNNNTASVAATITPTVVAGIVTSITATGGAYAANGSGNGQLPIPNLTFGGTGSCVTVPTFTWAPAAGRGWMPTLATGGTGCPSNLTITVQSVYPNPFSMYPNSRIAFSLDPSLLNVPPTLSNQNPAEYSGYVVTDPWASTAPANGDNVVNGVWWNQYLNNHVTMEGNILSSRSNRFGPIDTETWLNVGGQPLKAISNLTPANYYFGREINHYQQGNPSLPPCPAPGKETVPCFDPMDAVFGGPTGREFQGTYSTGILFDFPPSSVITVTCNDGFGGVFTRQPCNGSTPVWNPYNLFSLSGNSRFDVLQYNPNGGNLTWTGTLQAENGLVVQNGATINGTTNLNGPVNFAFPLTFSSDLVFTNASALIMDGGPIIANGVTFGAIDLSNSTGATGGRILLGNGVLGEGDGKYFGRNSNTQIGLGWNGGSQMTWDDNMATNEVLWNVSGGFIYGSQICTPGNGLCGSVGTPASSSAACTPPQIEYDASFIYTCVATNTWTRAATTTF